MDMDGDHQEPTKWTLEHHKKFVDIVIRLGGFNKIGTPRSIVAEMMNNVKGLSQRTIVQHGFVSATKQTTQLSLDRISKPDPYQSFMNEFVGLQVLSSPKRLLSSPKRLISSWTVEHHKRIIEVVTKLGGMSKATPKAVLKLIDIEERRQLGLTVRILRRHLSGLQNIQKKTQKTLMSLVRAMLW